MKIIKNSVAYLGIFFSILYGFHIISGANFEDAFPYANPYHLNENCAGYEIYFFHKKMKSKYGLKPGDADFIVEGKIGAQKEIKKMFFVFHKKGDFTVARARKLFLDVISSFCNGVNEDDNIKKYFVPKQCSWNDIELTLHFIPKSKINLSDNIEIVTNEDGKLMYKYYDDQVVGYRTIYTETYDEALYANLKELNGNQTH